MTLEENLEGRTLGSYQIIELIGEGRMATVYKAWQSSQQRYVALKVWAPHLADDAEFARRFQQEAESAASLEYTNIVAIHDVGVEGCYHYIAMELIEGGSLEERVHSGPTFTLEQVVDIISQVGSALDYAHVRGFVHLDIKPANILFDASDRVVLTDFGIIKALSSSGVTAPLAQGGGIVGTSQYMSPEQIQGESLDYRSDLYSLGIVCYEMLSGQVPFDGTTTDSVLYAQINNPPPSLRELASLTVSPAVEAVVEKMLSKDRDDRYNSATEFACELAQAVAGMRPSEMDLATAVAMPSGKTAMVSASAQPVEYSPTVVIPREPQVQTSWSQEAPSYPRQEDKRRSVLMLGLIGGGAVLVLLMVAAIAGVILGPELLPGLFGQGGTATPTVIVEMPVVAAEAPTATMEAPTATAQAPAFVVMNQIAFTSERDGNAEIYLMNSDGSGQTNLTNSPSEDYYPRISSDRSSISFHSYPAGSTPGEVDAQIYVIDLGTGQKDLVDTEVRNAKFADWSPDDQELVFAGERDGGWDLYIVNLTTGATRQLTEDSANDLFPVWSPDGDRIAFVREDGEDREIYVVDADGSNLRNLSNNPGWDWHPNWSFDGQRIAFTGERTGIQQIYVMNADGSGQRQLADDLSVDNREPAWSPDGSRIVFRSSRDGNWDIYTMSLDGMDLVRLTSGAEADYNPHWR